MRRQHRRLPSAVQRQRMMMMPHWLLQNERCRVQPLIRSRDRRRTEHCRLLVIVVRRVKVGMMRRWAETVRMHVEMVMRRMVMTWVERLLRLLHSANMLLLLLLLAVGGAMGMWHQVVRRKIQNARRRVRRGRRAGRRGGADGRAGSKRG